MDHPVFSSPQRLSRRLAMNIAAGFLLLLCSFPGIAASPSRTQADALQQELERLVSGLDGSAGIYVLDLRSGRAATVNPQVGFPMASTIKVPVAVHILALVDEGKLDLQQQVQLQEGDIYTAMGGPMALHLTPGSAITVRDLLHMMITVSDNNATDIMIRLGGGAAAVDARMRALVGLARTGSVMSNGSGDYVIAFSTARDNRRDPDAAVQPARSVAGDATTPLFQATAEATEEAIVNSLFRAQTVHGHRGTAAALPLQPVIEALRDAQASKPKNP